MRFKSGLLRLIASLALVLTLCIQVFPSAAVQAADTQADNPTGKTTTTAETQAAAPKLVQLKSSETPPQISSERLAKLEAAQASRYDRHKLPQPQTDPNAVLVNAPPSSPPTQAGAKPQTEGAGKDAPGTFSFFKFGTPSGVEPFGYKSSTSEPSTSNAGQTVFYTANWYDARSLDGGSTWSYINPYTEFPTVYGDFCCDQDTLYSPAYGIFIWHMQYEDNGAGSTNNNRIAIATLNSIKTNTWWYYDFQPSNQGFLSNDTYDYPHLGMSSNYLYLTLNVFAATGGFAKAATILRLPLASLAAAAGFSYRYYNATSNFSFVTTQGATSTMYFGSHNNSTSIRIWTWPEADLSPVYNDVSHASQTYNYSCASPNGGNACQRLDSRLQTGWVAKGRVGFMWNVGSGTDGLGTFAYPYVRILQFNQTSKALLYENSVYNGGFAWFAPSSAPNARGDLAGTIVVSGGGRNPENYAWIWDDYNGGNSPQPLENYYIAGSSYGPASNRWGDYLRTRASSNTGLQWIGTAYILKTGSCSQGCSEAYYLRFGRNRDNVTEPLVYYPLATPVRLLDTRPGQSTCITRNAPLYGGNYYSFVGRGITCGSVSIPASAQTLVGNATAVNNVGGGSGFATLFPYLANQPTVSNLNYSAGQIVANAFTLQLGSYGYFNIYSSQTTHYVIDITGYYAPPGAGLYYHPLASPIRLYDSRVGQGSCYTPGGGTGALQGNVTYYLDATKTCSGLTIPDDAQVIVGNATVVNNAGSTSGFTTVFPAGTARPNASNVNFQTAGQIVPNQFTVKLGTGGSAGLFYFYTNVSVNIIFDVTGYYSATASDVNGAGLYYYGLAGPVRLLDTRLNTNACTNKNSPITGGSAYLLSVNNRSCWDAYLPSGAKVAVGNATAVGNVGALGGFITLYPGGSSLPPVSNLNFVAGKAVPNAFTVRLGSGGFNVYANRDVNFLIDVGGYFA